MKEGDIIKHPFRPINVRIEYAGDKVYKFTTKQGIGYEAIEGSKQYNELDKDPRFIKKFFKQEPSVEIDLSTEIESKTMVMPEREAIKYKTMKEEAKRIVEQLEKLTGKKVVLTEGPMGFRPSYMGSLYTATVPVTVLVDVDVEATDEKDAKNKALTNNKVNNSKFEKDIVDQIIQNNPNIKIISAETLPILNTKLIAIEAKHK